MDSSRVSDRRERSVCSRGLSCSRPHPPAARYATMLGLKATMVCQLCPERSLPVSHADDNSKLILISRIFSTASSDPSNLAQAIIDNSGALVAECVNVLKTKTGHGMARIGEPSRSTSFDPSLSGKTGQR